MAETGPGPCDCPALVAVANNMMKTNRIIPVLRKDFISSFLVSQANIPVDRGSFFADSIGITLYFDTGNILNDVYRATICITD